SRCFVEFVNPLDCGEDKLRVTRQRGVCALALQKIRMLLLRQARTLWAVPRLVANVSLAPDHVVAFRPARAMGFDGLRARMEGQNGSSGFFSAKSVLRTCTSNTRWSEIHQSIAGTSPRMIEGEHLFQCACFPSRARTFNGSGSAFRKFRAVS